ncbi:conserved hypothetical protein [Pediculus humanus corporis]|uniref:Transcriptional regulatory protein n=1 Tax=Pediculus humanus subsp. corporis TaxID=121224 RepID=E0W206_PEDHC|nr:uncharacterized protein Phum_PHUM580890 [Pediculus humanus corporis]EEB19600.1 conserved hypothetical protein [Pediculus humanus corporis]
MFSSFLRVSSVFFTNVVVQSRCNFDVVNQISKRWAGHSKWSNIKHVKMAKDQARASLFNKLSYKISLAAKEGENPETNSKLKAALAEAKQANMPNATIQGAIKKAKDSLAEKPYWLIYSSLDGLQIGFEVRTANPLVAVSKLNTFCKRLGLRNEKRGSDHYNEKGIIISKSNGSEDFYSRAVEDAIETNIEEVVECGENTIVFECLPEKLQASSNKLSAKGYEISDAFTEITFHNYVKITSDEMSRVKKITDRIESEFEDLLRIADNIKRDEN